MERRRLTAYKVRIKDIMEGEYKSGGEQFAPTYVLTPYGLRLSRVRVMATVVSQYISDDRRYAFMVLDDGTATIRSKAFQDIKLIEKVKTGDVVDFIGRVREYNDERYLIPEIIIKITDPNMETLRMLEVAKFLKEKKEKAGMAVRAGANMESAAEQEEAKSEEQKKEAAGEKEEAKADIGAAKEEVLKAVKELDSGKGADYASIIEKVKLPSDLVESAINELLEEGSCYEPRAGRIKIL